MVAQRQQACLESGYNFFPNFMSRLPRSPTLSVLPRGPGDSFPTWYPSSQTTLHSPPVLSDMPALQGSPPFYLPIHKSLSAALSERESSLRDHASFPRRAQVLACQQAMWKGVWSLWTQGTPVLLYMRSVIFLHMGLRDTNQRLRSLLSKGQKSKGATYANKWRGTLNMQDLENFGRQTTEYGILEQGTGKGKGLKLCGLAKTFQTRMIYLLL